MFALLTLPRGPAPPEPESVVVLEPPAGIVIRPGPEPRRGAARGTLTRLAESRPA